MKNTLVFRLYIFCTSENLNVKSQSNGMEFNVSEF